VLLTPVSPVTVRRSDPRSALDFLSSSLSVAVSPVREFAASRLEREDVTRDQSVAFYTHTLFVDGKHRRASGSATPPGEHMVGLDISPWAASLPDDDDLASTVGSALCFGGFGLIERGLFLGAFTHGEEVRTRLRKGEAHYSCFKEKRPPFLLINPALFSR
jgi:hypothetical protein